MKRKQRKTALAASVSEARLLAFFLGAAFVMSSGGSAHSLGGLYRAGWFLDMYTENEGYGGQLVSVCQTGCKR